jgi:transposase
MIYNKKDWRKIQLNKKQKKELKQIENEVKNPQFLKRIQCIRLKNKGWKHEEISDFLQVTKQTVTKWIKMFFEKGANGLLEWGCKGKQSVLTDEHKQILKKRHKEKPFDTAKEAKEFIEKEFNIDFHLHWVQKLLKKNFDFRTKKQL